MTYTATKAEKFMGKYWVYKIGKNEWIAIEMTSCGKKKRGGKK